MTLVIGRRVGEQIQVGDDVLITIIGRLPDGTIRVGVDAPRHIRITRPEPRPTKEHT